MQQLRIKYHSFIDIITNSSTEIYVSVGDWSVKTVKDLVNGMLKIAKSDKTCDDLFEISINNYRCEEWILGEQVYDYFVESNKMTRDEYKVLTDDEKLNKFYQESGETYETMSAKYYEHIEDDYDSFDESSLLVKAKTDDPDVIEVAKILHNLRDIFAIEASAQY